MNPSQKRHYMPHHHLSVSPFLDIYENLSPVQPRMPFQPPPSHPHHAHPYQLITTVQSTRVKSANSTMLSTVINKPQPAPANEVITKHSKLSGNCA